jgi:hypothetical protein
MPFSINFMPLSINFMPLSINFLPFLINFMPFSINMLAFSINLGSNGFVPLGASFDPSAAVVDRHWPCPIRTRTQWRRSASAFRTT